jgi:hypothetical protein
MSLGVSHLSYAYNVGIETERRHNQILLAYIIGRVIRRAGESMYDVVLNSPLLISFKER